MSSETTNTAAANSTKENPTKSTTSTGVIIIPKNLDLQFKAIAQKVDFQELHLTKANGNLKMKNGKLYLQNTNFNLIGCQVGMNALYESLTAKKALFEYQIKATDFDIKRAYKEVKIFREMASAAEKAQGIVSLDYKLKGKYGTSIPIISRERSFIRKRH
jgi:AsmA protein